MSVSQCPCCNDEVRIPAGVPNSATVRCPLCKEEFPLGDVGLPPMLEVISGADAPGPLAVEQGSGAMPAFSLGDSAPSEGAGTVTTAAKSSVRRPSRKSSSPIKEMLKIVGGGVVGLTIGQLALWYLPGEWKTKQRDPFGLGPKVASFAPWLVPEQVSGKTQTSSDPTDPLTNQPPTDQTKPTTPPPNTPDRQLADANNIDLGNVGMNAKDNGGGAGGGRVVEFAPKQNPSPPEIDVTVPEPSVGPAPEPPTVADPLNGLTIDDPLSGLGTDPAPTDPPGDVDGLSSAINAADAVTNRIAREWTEMETSDKATVLKEYYDAMVEVEKQVAQLGADHKVIKNRADEIRNLFMPNLDLANNVRRHGIRQFGHKEALAEDNPVPLVLYGEVESMGVVEGQPIIRLSVDDGNQGAYSVLLLAPSRHDGSYKPKSSLFVIGARLAEDQHQFDDPRVVRADVIAVTK